MATEEIKDGNEKVVLPIRENQVGVQDPSVSTIKTPEQTPEQIAAREKAEKEEKERKDKEEADRLAEEEKKEKEKEKEKIDDVDTTEEIEIDGKVYQLDENGNAIEDDKIVYTKDAIEKMAADSVDDSTIATIKDISEKSGIVPIDETGNEIEYDWSVEGLARRESDILNIGKAEGFKEGFNQFLMANPDIADIINYKNNFGTIEGYSNNIDYLKMELPDKDEDLYQMIIKAEIQKGTSPERAKRLADFAKSNNTLKDDAKESLEYLKKIQETKIKSIREQQELANQQARESDVKFYGIDYDNNSKEVVKNIPGSVYDIVMSKGEVKGYSIPLEGISIRTKEGVRKISRKELFDYISKPVYEEGGIVYTQAQLDEIRIGQDPQEYVLRCIHNLDGGVESLVKKAINDKQVKTIKKLSSTKRKDGGIPSKVEKEDRNAKIILPVMKQ